MSEDSKHNKYDASVFEDDQEIEEESNQSPSEKKEELIKKKFVHRLQIIHNQGTLIDFPTFA